MKETDFVAVCVVGGSAVDNVPVPLLDKEVL